MKNAIIKFLLQRRFLWTRKEDHFWVEYNHFIFGPIWVSYIGFDDGLDAVISELIKDL